MSNNTPVPWRVSEETFDNDGIKESVIRGLNGRAAIAVTLDFGQNNPDMREANARRIVACVNACAGISNDNLENFTLVSGGIKNRMREQVEYLNGVEKQHDDLLAELDATLTKWEARSRDALPADSMLINRHVRELKEAIAKAKEGAES